MPDLQKLHTSKERILAIIKNSGPSFPARIARETSITPLFVSAFLAELVSEKRLKISDLKVGSSPLYYLIGQEKQLENFIEHLNPKQREAFELIKNSEVLEDEKQEPAIRVALRSIKDFAFPINARLNNEVKIFWRYLSFPQEKIKEKIKETLSTKSISKIPTASEMVTPQEKTKPEPPKTHPQKQGPNFSDQMKDYLAAKDIEIMEEYSAKKREFTGKIRIDTHFGKQEYYLFSKEKKKVTEKDLSTALEKSKSEKMPAIFMSPGETDKKAKEYLRHWKNLIKFEKLRF